MIDEILSFGALNHKRLLPHRNKGMEIVYVSRGHLHWRVEDRREDLPAGSLFFSLPWQTHGSTLDIDPPNFICWVLFRLDRFYPKPVDHFRFPSSLGFTSREDRRISGLLCASQRHSWKASRRIAAVFPDLIEELETRDAYTATAARSLLKTVILELARSISKNETSTDLHRTLSAEGRVQSFLNSLGETCGEDWSLDGMAKACDLGRSQFSALVSKLTGTSPIDMLNRSRIALAQRLLLTRDLSVTDVAFRCGFNSSQYFARSFKQLTDTSPSRFRAAVDHSGKSGDQVWDDVGWRTIKEEKYRSKNRRQVLSW